jgi:hypothetical protein
MELGGENSIDKLGIFVCLDFEGILQVRISLLQPQDKAEVNVERQKEWSPTFVLAHVNVFMTPRASEAIAVAAKDHVS